MTRKPKGFDRILGKIMPSFSPELAYNALRGRFEQRQVDKALSRNWAIRASLDGVVKHSVIFRVHLTVPKFAVLNRTHSFRFVNLSVWVDLDGLFSFLIKCRVL